MTKRGVAVMCALLLAWSLANTIVIHAYDRQAELFPMAAYELFSGTPREFVRRFVFEVVPQSGDRPIEVPGGDLIGYGPYSSRARRVLEGVWYSHDNGCPDYRLSNHRACREDPVRPWRIPRDLAADWVRHSIKHLGLAEPPHAITLVKVDTPLKRGKPLDRTPILTWRPRSGSYRTEAPR
jgi:hypothetical protein